MFCLLGSWRVEVRVCGEKLGVLRTSQSHRFYWAHTFPERVSLAKFNFGFLTCYHKQLAFTSRYTSTIAIRKSGQKVGRNLKDFSALFKGEVRKTPVCLHIWCREIFEFTNKLFLRGGYLGFSGTTCPWWYRISAMRVSYGARQTLFTHATLYYDS